MTCNSPSAFRRQHLAFVFAPVMLLILATPTACAQDKASTQTDTSQQSNLTTSDFGQKAATDQPAASNTWAKKGDFALFDGEWKLHAANYGTEEHRTRTSGLPELGWIRNGIIRLGKNSLAYRVIESGQTRGVIRIVAQDSQESMCEVERLDQILFLRITAQERDALEPDAPEPDTPKPDAPSDLNLARPATEHSRQDVVLEFWRIDPQRQEVMKQLESLLYKSNSLRQTGTSEEFSTVNRRVQQVTAQLQKLDDAPRIQSLTYEVLAARKAGKHKEANQLELQIPALPAQADSLPMIQPEFNDLEAQQDIGIRITDTLVALDQLKRNLGAQHPQVREAQQRLTFLQSLRNKDKNSGNNSQQQITASRAQLEKERQSLLAEYDSAQQVTHQVASDLRSKAAQESIPPDVLLSLQQQLRKTVTAAFDVQQKLQTIRLSIAQRDLQDLRSKHEHRKTLAEQVIERRVQQLLQDDELLWSESNGGKKTTEPKQPKQKPQYNIVEKATLTDSQLLGEWTLVQASQSDGMALQPNSRLSVSDNRLQLSRYGQQLQMRLQTNTQVTPHQVSIVDVSNILVRFTGTYQITDDVLTIVWASHDQQRAGLTTLQAENSGTQIWKRVKPLPTFETPEQLLSFFDSITQSESPDVAMLVRLLSDKEADRFAGFLIASTGMMQRMMPLIMMAEQMGDTDDDGHDLATLTRVSTLLNKAIAPNAPLECVQAFRDLTNTDSSFMTAQFRVPMTDIDAFSEKLRLAGRAVGDSRMFAVQILNLLDGMSDKSAKQKKDKPKPDWLVTRDGDRAFAVNQATVKPKDDLGGGKLSLQRIENSWTIASLIADDNLAEIAAMATGPIMGTDKDGNTMPIGTLFGAMAESTPTMLESPTTRAVQAPMANQSMAPYTKITANDLGTIQVMTDESNLLTNSDVVGKYLTRRLSRNQRITPDMLVDEPTTEEIVNAYLEEALAGEEVFPRAHSFPDQMVSLIGQSHDSSRSFPNPSQSLHDFPYGANLEELPGWLPDWTSDYVAAVAEKLNAKANNDWQEPEFRLLWSLEPLVFYSSEQLNVDLQRLASLLKNKYPTVEQIGKHPKQYSILWHSDLVMGMYVRLNGELPKDVFDLPVVDEETAKQLALLQTMCANSADFQWINQEQVRLAGLLQKAPVPALKTLMSGQWPVARQISSGWLYALSTRSQYRTFYASSKKGGRPPVDTMLMVLVMKSLTAETESSDDNIAAYLEEPSQGGAFSRHLNDLLSSKLTYRDTALDALAQMYQKTSRQKLKAAIKKAAPGASVSGI
ncbi:MAG: hypothetical protein ABJZ55_17195 [Fuerstiella sp.]